MSNPQPGIETRVKRAMDGSTKDLIFLLQFYRPILLAYIDQSIPPGMMRAFDAEDIYQDTYTCVMKDLPTFKYVGDDSFLHWVKAIARNRCFDEIRRARTAKRGGHLNRLSTWHITQDSATSLLSLIATTSHTASRSVSRREAVESLREAVAELPSIYRQVVLLHHLEGRPLREVGDRLGKTPNAVQKLAARALNALGKALGANSGSA